MKRLALGLLFALWSSLALAQGCGPTNPNCIVPTAPAGTNNNQAASTAYVLQNGGASSAALDTTFGSTRGSILERGAAGWAIAPPGTSGLPWTSNGAGADPAYQGLANSGFAAMPAWTFKGNATSGSAAPTDVTIDGLTLKAVPATNDEMMIWDVAGTAWKKVTASSLPSSVLRSYIAGGTISNVSGTAIAVSAAQVTSDDQTTLMGFAGLSNKNLSIAWAVGNVTGCLDTGSISTNTWYHIFIIERTDTQVVDVLCSLSATTPTLPANYTKQRRIGAVKTDATPNVIAFNQNGDEFIWAAATADISTSTLGTTATLFLLTVPTGVKVNALFRGGMSNAATGVFLLINSPDENSVATNSPSGNFTAADPIVSTVSGATFTLNLRTNTSSQIRAVASAASTSLSAVTYGWIDTRGRNN